MIYGPVGRTEDNTPTIAWQDLTGAVDYELLVYHVERGLEVVAGIHINETYFTTNELAIGGTYEAYVRAIFPENAPTAWSPMRQFEIVHEAPTRLVAPNSFTTAARPTFVWTEAATANSYELLVYNVDTGREVERISGIKQTSATLARSYYGATLEAYVRIETASGAGRWSAPLRVKSLSIMVGLDSDNDDLKLFADPADEENPVTLEDTESADANDKSAQAFADGEIEQVDAVMEEWVEMEWWSDVVHVNQ